MKIDFYAPKDSDMSDISLKPDTGAPTDADITDVWSKLDFEVRWQLNTLDSAPIKGHETECKAVIDATVTKANTLRALAVRMMIEVHTKQQKFEKHIKTATSDLLKLLPPVLQVELAKKRKAEDDLDRPQKKARPDKDVFSFTEQKQRKDLAPRDWYDIAPRVSIQAVKIKNREECHDHLGKICWWPDGDRFLRSTNGFIEVLDPRPMRHASETRYKTREFKEEIYCPDDKKNDFYHPPDVYGGHDHRSFEKQISYHPASEPTPLDALRVGDSYGLYDDLRCIENQDARFATDLAAHMDGVRLALLYSKRL